MSPSFDALAWGLGWSLLTLVVFALPLWPAWRELRSATDADPLPIDDLDDGLTSYRARTVRAHLPRLETLPVEKRWPHANTRAVRVQEPLVLGQGQRAELLVSTSEVTLQPGSRVTRAVHARRLRNQGMQLPLRASADETMVLEPGSRFFRISASLILTTPLADAAPALPDEPASPAQPVTERRFHKGPMLVRVGQHVHAHLVIDGDLTLEENASITGDVKVHGHVRLAKGAWLAGALFAQGHVECAGYNRVQGPLCAEQAVHLGPHFQGGRSGSPCSISGWEVHLGESVRVFGSITAVTGGQVQA
ncbi:MAG: polymer-forming cytoskeletal protein [Comamonadaceae bacterium]|nr:polymer-forming cytoskeletal protein [Comamonadaceae bacterium]